LGCFGVVALAFCLAVYPFYDAYVGRRISDSDIRELDLEANISNWGPSSFVNLTSKARSQEWLFDAVEVTLTLKLKNGSSRKVVVRSSKLSGAVRLDWLLKLPEEEAQLFREAQVAGWTWWLTDSKARRRPIKLVKIIADLWDTAWESFGKGVRKTTEAAAGLFERT